MLDTIKDFKYKKIKNFLSTEEVELLKNYTRIQQRVNFKNFDFELGNNADTVSYGDPVADGLMVSKLKKMNELTGLKLLPTYSFYRVYTYGATLFEHKDRPACEVSVTVQIDSCGTDWPIYMEGNPISIESGDAVIYLGCDLKHKRDEFKGDYHTQFFLHYVDHAGPHKEWFKDKRDFYGTMSNRPVDKHPIFDE